MMRPVRCRECRRPAEAFRLYTNGVGIFCSVVCREAFEVREVIDDLTDDSVSDGVRWEELIAK